MNTISCFSTRSYLFQPIMFCNDQFNVWNGMVLRLEQNTNWSGLLVEPDPELYR